MSQTDAQEVADHDTSEMYLKRLIFYNARLAYYIHRLKRIYVVASQWTGAIRSCVFGNVSH